MGVELQIVAVIGFLLSIYAEYIDRKAEKQKNFKAACDFSEGMSCTAVIGSQYGNIFGVSNALAGIFFYVLIFVAVIFNATYVFYLAILSVLGSAYFAYLQYFKIKKMCLVCSAIYVLNILLVILAYIATF